MTISKIYIGAFGGLKDYTLELDSGLNVIYGENENGKSTVMAFIKMMFYGSGRKSQQISKNPRQKYLPWDTEHMGGRIYFEHNGHRYCLEREFRKSDATDRITLRDLDLGTSENAPSDIGKRFFELGEQAFERSVFIGSAAANDTDEAASGELNARLSNIASTGDESTSYQTVAKRIEEAVGELMTQRHVGIYDKGLVRLEQLKKEYAAADEAAKRREGLSERIKQLKTHLTEIKASYIEIKQVLDSENDLRQADKLQEYLIAKQELDDINSTLLLNDGGQIDSVYIGKVNFCLSKYATECTRVEEKTAQCSRLRESIELAEAGRDRATPQRLEEIKQKADALQKQHSEAIGHSNEIERSIKQKEIELEASRGKKKALNPLLLVIGLIVLALGVAAFTVISKHPLGLAASAAIGVILVILSFILRPADRTAAQKAEIELLELKGSLNNLKAEEAELIGRINSATSEMNMISAALNTDKALLEQRKQELATLSEQLTAAEELKQNALNELIAVYSRCSSLTDPKEITESLKALSERADEQKSIKLRLKYLSNDLGNISYEAAAQKLKEISARKDTSDIDFAALKQQADMLNDTGVALSSELSAAAAELKSELKGAVDPEDLATQISELEAKLTEQKQYIEAAQLAASVMEDSFAQLRRSYGSALEKRTLEIFSDITDGHYSRVNVSGSMELEAETAGDFGAHSIEYLSSGTVDQAYLSLRLALAELIAVNERLPIMLDDSLSQYDDKRAATALAALKKYSASAQTVLFTCHEAICHTAEELGATPKKLREN